MKKSIFCLPLSVILLAPLQTRAEVEVATFDNLYLAPESHWRGDENSDTFESSFTSGSFTFDNYLMAEYDFWAKFAYSNETSTEYTTLADQFRSAVGCGVNKSANYGMAYVSDGMFGPGSTCLYINNTTNGEIISGCYITNSAWAKDAILNGDGQSTIEGGFTTGDYFYLTATGTHADGSTHSIDFYLADYQSENTADHYYLDTWQWLDLRPLGAITKLSFAMNSSRSNAYGITTPTYFCLDDLGGEYPLQIGDEIEVTQNDTALNLSQYFIFDNNEATITYMLADEYESLPAEISLSDNILTLSATTDCDFSLVVCAIQKGKQQYVQLPVSIRLQGATQTITAEQVKIYPVPTKEYLHIATRANNYTIELISIDGICVYTCSGLNGSASIPVYNLTEGAYIARISDGTTTIIKRFTKIR